MKSKTYITGKIINNYHSNKKPLTLPHILFGLCFLLCGMLVAASEIRAATITVDRADDTAAASACTAAVSDCSLRGAFAFANANSGTIINLPAGTYNLTIDELQVGTAANISTTINGTGTPTINQTVANRRIIDLNPTLAANVVVSISGVRFTGGNSPSDNFGGGAIIGGGAVNTLNLTNCIFENNSDVNAMTAKGGAVEWAAGGFLNIDNCTFNNNTAGSGALNKGSGGGVDYNLLNLAGTSGQGGLTITNSTFTANKAGASNSGAGGAVNVTVTTTQTPRTVTITNNTFTGNQANAASNGFGGAITSSSAFPITVRFNRIVGNTATGGITGVYQATGTLGTINATDNWWGCNAGPGNTGCDSIGGVTANITTNPRIVLLHTPNTNPIVTGQATTLTASFLRDSANNVLTTANISRLIGLPITFNNAVRGTISAAQTTIQASGTATATFTSNSAGAGSANAVVDNQATLASITINKANTTITIISDTPDPTVTGQGYTVTFNSPTVTAPGAGTPTGTVTVSDGSQTCTATLPALSCALTSTTIGAKNLTAIYNGDANYNASPVSASIPHTVNKANTTAIITADTPDPSVFGQNYAVSVSVAVNSPGSGTTTGTITITEGTNNCTITLPATSCNLPGNSVGAKTLTATYNGDANFNASPVSAGVSHTVNPAATTTTISSDLPDPSAIGQNVVVIFTVTVNAPGAGTPTGNVTVTDGVDSCIGTVAAGQCTLALTTVGSRTLTATYAGSTNFNGSASVGAAHTVSPSSAIVSGTVTYLNAPTTTVVPNTTISAAGSIPLSTSTNTSGVYSLTGFGNGAYTFTPSKANQVNPSNGFTSMDASLVAQHLAGLITLNANQLIAADTTGNGIISPLDAAYIAQFIVGTPNPGITGSWKFLPASRSYANLLTNQSNQDFGAILVGDVSGSWNPLGAPISNSSTLEKGIPASQTIAINVSSKQSAAEKQAFNVELTATETAGAGILGYQFDLLYDTSVIEPQAAACDTTGTISRNQTAVCRAEEPGILKVVVFGTTALSGKGNLLNLKFNVIGANGEKSPLEIRNFMFNEGLPQNITTDGEIFISKSISDITSISGQLFTAAGESLADEIVTLTNNRGETATARTNAAGTYRFDGVRSGENYTLSVSSERFIFKTQNFKATATTGLINLFAEQPK